MQKKKLKQKKLSKKSQKCNISNKNKNRIVSKSERAKVSKTGVY